ncbi:MAG: class I SAM-dependent methyltransferase [Pseudomonadota bacterium]|nr:MAG: class I SAM-dependent methyltransferase [Pseudomonadota bacterium]
MSDDWYLDETFWRNFGSLMFNDATFARGEAEVQQLLELVGGEPETVLDLGCGPGRHALPLADAGLSVTAVDSSPWLLQQLAARRGARSIEITEGDMRQFRRQHAFDLVVVLWTSFGYFENEADHRRVLDNIHASLRPGGRLVLDLVGLEYLCRNLQPVHLTEYDDGRVLVERPVLIDDLTRVENEWLLIDQGHAHRATFSHRVWSAGELRALLTAAGFEDIRVHGSYAGDDYDLDAERQIAMARCGDY